MRIRNVAVAAILSAGIALVVLFCMPRAYDVSWPPGGRTNPSELDGRVIDETGAGVANATVEAVWTLRAADSGLGGIRRILARTMSLADGSFSMSLRSRHQEVWLAAHAPEYGRGASHLADFRAEPLVVVISSRARAVAGVVTGDDGTPVSGANIEVGNGIMSFGTLAHTDAQGRFRVASLPVGGGVIGVIADGFAPSVREFDGSMQLEIELSVGAVAFGVVQDTRGRAIAGARVLCGEWPSRFVRTDREGTYELTGVPIDQNDEPVGVIYILAPGYVSAAVDVRDDGVRRHNAFRIDTVLEPSGSVKFRVVDEHGNPISQADVEYTAGPHVVIASADDSGEVRIEALEAGSTIGALWVSCPGFFQTQSEPVTVAHGPKDLGDIVLVPRETDVVLKGRVLDSVKIASEPVVVSAWIDLAFGKAIVAIEECEPSGRFQLRVPANRSVRINAERGSRETIPIEVSVRAAGTTLTSPLQLPAH